LPNVANLLLARATTPKRKIALRTFRAGRWRSFATHHESIAALDPRAALVSPWLSTVLPRSSPLCRGYARISDVAVDARVLAFTPLSLSHRPAFRLPCRRRCFARRPHQALKTAAKKSGAAKGHGFSRSLIIGEVAIAAILVIGAGPCSSKASGSFPPQSRLSSRLHPHARITPNQSFCEFRTLPSFYLIC